MILLNPGPANTTETVKQAQVVEDICPREQVFGDLLDRVRRDLVRVVAPDDSRYAAVLFGGSGTAAVEATLASTVGEGDRLLVVDNGAYGSRMAKIAKAYGMPHDVLELGVGAYPEPAQVAAALEKAAYTHLAIVHHETTTGMLNPVEAIASYARAKNVDVIVDAMSSYAGLPIDIEAMGAQYLISSSNKCVQGMAGLGFAICERSRLETLETIPGRSLYLNLAEQHRFFDAHRQMRFTPPVQTVYALARALEELFLESPEARYERYGDNFEALDEGVRALGFRRLLPDAMLSRILTAYVEPDHPRYSYDEMHDRLFDKGFTIYPGKGAKKATFRLANMGAVTSEDMRSFVRALGETIGEMGIDPLYGDAAL